MARLLPSTPDTSAADEAEPRVIGVDSEDADDLLSALSSDTARKLLSMLHDDPDTPSGLASRVDSSLQNVQYHLKKLERAGLVDVVDTVYSEKGREMNVYAPADRPLVVFAGRESESAGLKAALKRLLASVGILAAVSVVVQIAATGQLPFVAQSGAGDGGSAELATSAVETTASTAPAFPPGLAFFLGGLVVLAFGFALWYARR
ncbi:ArsR family transcriptional regulator [Haloprofundus marisrubri]|uniref:ArsR family transcriptional regulator n=1 Tax=Haloprofundus marisrubri TaxID=1514971 RepID=A0A0W1RCK4_9EURY|nr:winged helix-turn-helix domain-containing protein [Haloprofundus marisrubri]KTG11164.1 ArsR family transcriptional regulator [Haloprofundus marisrubri]